jgi:hypothetical protein
VHPQAPAYLAVADGPAGSLRLQDQAEDGQGVGTQGDGRFAASGPEVLDAAALQVLEGTSGHGAGSHGLDPFASSAKRASA